MLPQDTEPEDKDEAGHEAQRGTDEKRANKLQKQAQETTDQRVDVGREEQQHTLPTHQQLHKVCPNLSSMTMCFLDTGDRHAMGGPMARLLAAAGKQQ
jgi:hypothetical protein